MDKRTREYRRKERVFASIAVIFILFRIVLYLIPDPLLDAYEASLDEVCIELDGAIQRPGTYFVPRNSSLHALLHQIGLQEGAKLPKDRLLDKPSKWIIGSKKHLYIRFKGALERPGVYRFPRGYTLKQAIGCISLKEKADISGLDLDKKLRHGSTYRILEKNRP